MKLYEKKKQHIETKQSEKVYKNLGDTRESQHINGLAASKTV